MNIFYKADLYLFHIINNLAGNAIIDAVILYFSKYFVFILVLFAFIRLYFYSDKKYFFIVILTIALSFIFKFLLGFLYFRNRPFVSLKKLNYIGYHSASNSMPSGHTIFAFSFLYPLKKNLFFYFVLLFAVLIAFSRIYLGYHYPSDIIAGIIVSYLFYRLSEKIYYFLKRKAYLN